MQRVGIFGGTFDPPHHGHLIAAVHARHQLALDGVVLMVANDPWQKSSGRTVTPALDRLALVQAAVAGHPGLIAGDEEITRGGTTYTVDTVEDLRRAAPHVEPVLIVGADAFATIDSWHRSADLVRLVTFAVLDRPGAPAPPAVDGLAVERVRSPLIEISSSDIRARCRDGRPLDYLVPDGVRSEMRRLRLYGLGA